MPMHRIIDGIVFESYVTDDWSLRVIEMGYGQREAVVSRVVRWRELGNLDPQSINGQIAAGLREPDPDELADKARANLLRAARRAKTNVRRSVKSQGLDTLLTLTYRDNQADLAACKYHFSLFLSRVRRMIPGFRYVAAFERQARGAWHVHIATARLPAVLQRSGVKVKSWNVLRAAWRAVIGGSGGNVDIARRSSRRRSAGKLAAYLSKYLVKGWDSYPPGERRWQGSSCDWVVSQAEFQAASLLELIDLAYAFAGDGVCLIESSHLSRHGDLFYLSSGPVG